MGKPEAPESPDYYGLAEQQGEEYRNNALWNNYMNNPNIVSPYGSQTVTYGGQQGFDRAAYLAENPDVAAAYQNQQRFYGMSPEDQYSEMQSPGYNAPWAEDYTPYQHWIDAGGFDAPRNHGQAEGYDPSQGANGEPSITVTQQLNPAQQGLLDSQNTLAQNSLDTAINMMGNVNDSYAAPFDADNPDYSYSAFDPGNLPEVDQYDNSGFQDFTGIDRSQLPPGSQGLDFSNLGDFGAYDTDALTQIGSLSNEDLHGMTDLDLSQLYTRTVDPSVGGREDVRQAIMDLYRPGFEANRRSTDADLLARGFSPGGTGYDDRMRGLDDKWNRKEMEAMLIAGREQDRITNAENLRRGYDLDEQQAALGADLDIRGQQWGENRDIFESQMTQNQNEFYQQGQVASLADRQRGQQANEIQRVEAFASMLRDQGLNEQQVQAKVNAAIRQMQMQEEGARVSFGEGQRTSRFNEGMEVARLNNWVADQQYGRDSFERNRALNELNALRSGNQPAQLNFQPYVAANAQAAPIFDAGIAQGNFDLANFQNQPDYMGGLFDLGGAFLGAAGGAGGFGALFGGGA